MKKPTDIKHLTEKLEMAQKENEVLLNKIKDLENQILKERRQSAVDKTLLEYHQRQFSFALSDYLINPEPIKVHGTDKGRGIDFLIELMNVIAIKSIGRIKKIFLKTPIRPIEGGQYHNSITFNSDVSDFNSALYSIQGRWTHLIRVNKSVAVNIHYYDLESEKKLQFNIDPSTNLEKDLETLKTDKFFDIDTFNRRKIEFREINRYRKSPPIP